MNIPKLSLSILIFFSSLLISAQKNVITMDPSGFIGKKLLVISYERLYNRHWSFRMGAELGDFVYREIDNSLDQGGNVIDMKNYSVGGWGLRPEVKYYPINKKKRARGLFVGGYYQFRRFYEKYYAPAYSRAKGKSSHLGVSCGYKLIIGKCVLEPLVGYATSSIKWDDIDAHDDIQGMYSYDLSDFGQLRYEINVGFSFGR